MSSGSDSDDDYKPGEPEQLSEEESADDETETQYEQEQEQKKATKRKAKNKHVTNRKRTRNTAIEVTEKDEDEEINELDEEKDPSDEKKREDDLWAMFLGDTNTKPKPTAVIPKDSKEVTKPAVETKSTAISKTKNDADREKRIFEFAGETLVVENNIIKERIRKSEVSAASASTVNAPTATARGSGGLSSLLGQLNKKNKLSTLEKSKLDWETYKQEEGIEDEVQKTNKGKDGYLDRKDFLERADMRQYELEREARLSRRSNR